MPSWTAEPADEHGTPGLWAWDGYLQTLRYIARPDGADDRRVPADAYRLLRRVLCPTDGDVEEIAAELTQHELVTSSAVPWHCTCGQWSMGTGPDSYNEHVVRAVLAALADETGDE